MKTCLFAGLAITAFTALPAMAQETPSAEGAKIYFINLEDGATVSSPVKVVFGLSGMGVAPAGTEKENTGHHHLFVNRPALGEGTEDDDTLAWGIPGDDKHIHFGGGQTEATLDLPKGIHTLQMVLGDMNHVPHNPPVTSQVITITVD